MDGRMTFGGVHFGAKTQPLLSPNPINFDLNMNMVIMAQGERPVNTYFGMGYGV
jgi:hypothetical protein